MFEGQKESKVLFVSDFLRNKEAGSGKVLEGERRDILINALSSAGILASEYSMTVIHPTLGNKKSSFSEEQRALAQANCKKIINESKANLIVPLGEYALKFITGLDGIQKHHLSLNRSKADFGGRKVLPLLHPETVQKNYSDVAYIRVGCRKIREEMNSTLLTIPERTFKLSLDLGFEEIVAYLENIIQTATEVSTDVETGNGHVNTVGLATSANEAIVIEAGPNRWKPHELYKLWDLFRQIWESESIGKIAQNGLFEAQWASIYGIHFRNLSFDTMWAMKFLHPTLERGLDNVGRIYTRFPYWKDDHSDWNNIRNWRDHLVYCGKDVAGQFAAKENMELALRANGLSDQFHNFIMKQFPIAHEMMSRGLRLDESMLSAMRHNANRDIEAITDSFDRQCNERFGKSVNINSPKQVKEALLQCGVKIPTAKGKETVGRGALMKLKNKHPKEMLIRDLIKISELRKKTDEYLNFEYDEDSRVRFSLDLASDENGLWVGKQTIFNKGFDPTSVPQVVKNCIIADEGKTFMEIRLNQPELRYIAEDAPDYKLKSMLTEYKDVGRYLASKIFRKPEELINRNELKIANQVIKSANEMHAPKQFVEKCFACSGVFYTDVEAKRFMQMFLEEFSGCRNRIERIRKLMYSKRMLEGKTRKITYYDRVNDSLVRRALSWGPESSANDEITNLLIQLNTYKEFEFVTRNSHSLLMQIPKDSIHGSEGLSLSLAGKSYPMKIGDRWGSLDNV